MSSRASRRYGLSRRDVIKSAEGAAAAVGPFFHVTPTHAAIDETLNTWVINTMFAESAAGAETPEDALKRAETKMKGDLGEMERSKDDLIV